MKQLHASGEDYLEAILVLKRKKGMVRSVDVARHLDVSKPSVCHAVLLIIRVGDKTVPFQQRRIVLLNDFGHDKRLTSSLQRLDELLKRKDEPRFPGH